MNRPSGEIPLRFGSKVALAGRIWLLFVAVHFGLRRRPLPELVEHLSQPGSARTQTIPPRKLGRIVYRVLRVGSFRPRCLIAALVHYRLLREQGTEAELVIGLPREPKDKGAHAWIEVHGSDVGPPPGRGLHEVLARYP